MLMKTETNGLIIVHTGSGKGKTTAALGLALRAAGYGFRTLMIQFIKGTWRYGELDAADMLAPLLDIVPMGKGFIRMDQGGPDEDDRRAVDEAWDFAKARIFSGDYEMIVLDEITYVIDYGLLAVEDVLEVLRTKPKSLHLVLTGRNAHPDIIEAADLVTEMKEIKHPYQKGVKAQKGIEF
ncbi:MAG: cob(I)yrinic acid a,c-diamide adenosyltransferase [Desulfobacteraceae bacterium]|jgi:cob(I)alamin adenosyltransferase